MGLFRNWAKKHRDKAAARLVAEPIAVPAQAEAAHQEVTAEAAHREMPAETAHRQVTAQKAHREVTAEAAHREARPDPDRPGWGRIAGQSIGKVRGDRQP